MPKLSCLICILTICALYGCNSESLKYEIKDTVALSQPTESEPPQKDSMVVGGIPSVPHPPQAERPVMGSAAAYCPSRMIADVPCLVYAVLSKSDQKTLRNLLVKKVKGTEPTISDSAVLKDIREDSIPIYPRMKVTLAADDDVFKIVSKEEQAQNFDTKNTLEWNWELKPKHLTQKTFVTFRFYAIDSVGHTEVLILEKTISVAVQIDARTWFTKCIDFLFNDTKTLVTAILIPFFTFLFGLILGKRKKSATP